MDILRKLATGTVVTVLIGGASYTISQTDVVTHFSNDTGMTQEQAEQYINNISEDELVSFDKMGSDLISEGQEFLSAASEIDCVSYDYEWQSAALSCYQGKAQAEKLGRDTISLGQAYKRMISDSGTADDISETIRLIDQLNADYQFQIVSTFLDQSEIDEIRRTNSYNKAILKAALESN